MVRIDPVTRTPLTRTRRTRNPRLLEQDPISLGFDPIFSSHLLATPERWHGGKLPQSLKDGIIGKVPCYTPCFQENLTQNLARMDLTSLIKTEPTYILNQHTSYKHQMTLYGESAETKASIIWR